MAENLKSKFSLKEKVIWVLKKYPEYRDSKRKTIILVLQKEFEKLYPDVPISQRYELFIESLNDVKKLSDPDSIGREWQRVQEMMPELRGKKWVERHKHIQENVKKRLEVGRYAK